VGMRREGRPGGKLLGGHGVTAMGPHPKCNSNDEASPAGCSGWAEIVEKRMPAQ